MIDKEISKLFWSLNINEDQTAMLKTFAHDICKFVWQLQKRFGSQLSLTKAGKHFSSLISSLEDTHITAGDDLAEYNKDDAITK